MFTSRTTSISRGPAVLAATITLLLAALLGPGAASADTVRISNYETFPTVGYLNMAFTVTAYGDAVGTVYSEAGRTSCPASSGAAAAAGMDLVVSRTVAGDGVAHLMAADSSASAEGRYLFCAYVHRGSDTATARGTDAYTLDVEEEEDAPIVTVPARQVLSASNTVSATVSCPRACSLRVSGWAAGASSSVGVPLGAATATIGTFGGSTAVELTMTSTQRRWLRSLLAAGDNVQADLYATATYGNGTSFDTTAAAVFGLVTATSTMPVRVFSGA